MKAPEIRKTKHLAQIKCRRDHVDYLVKLVEKMEADLLQRKENLKALSINLEKDIEIAIEKGWMKK
jgi:Uri superfamily endonuclease